ncbi:GNAT family N-acetyltransferase [Polaribacter sp. R77954]|uniref:GNAT family N-acetyltransferase n=1 Tax=Polaribacter sp. R77954 TaxID=3093870 RepID=UPI0037C8679E
MKYEKDIKAYSEIFKKPPFINLNEHVIITHLVDKAIEYEAEWYYGVSQDSEIKRFLPDVYPESPKDAMKKVVGILGKPIFKEGLMLCIRSAEDKYAVGYIVLDSPLANTGSEEWTITYWLKKTQQGRGLMTNSIIAVLEFMKKMKISKVQAFVDLENIKSENILKNLNFKKVPGEFGKYHKKELKKSNLYELNL